MTSLADISVSLSEELEKTARESKARAVAVALLDFESGFRFSIAGDRWFHAARQPTDFLFASIPILTRCPNCTRPSNEQ